MKNVNSIGGLILLFLFSCHHTDSERPAIYRGEQYTVYPTEVVQGKYRTEAVSAHEIRSGYRSPADTAYSSVIRFKFSINSRDNEMPAGRDHELHIQPKNGSEKRPEKEPAEKRPVYCPRIFLLRSGRI